MLKKFDELAGRILLEAGAASDWSEDYVDESRYEFKTDENGNTVCVFQITRNGDKFLVTAIISGDDMKFMITDENKGITEMPRKQFAVEYWKDYEDLQKVLSKREAANDENPQQSEESRRRTNIPKIETFKDVMTDESGKEAVKDYNIGGKNIVVRKLNDPLVPNYCEVLFETVDPETKETVYNKALAICKPGKNCMLKIVQFNSKNERTNIIMPSDLQMQFPDVHEAVFKALVKFANYMVDMEL